MNQTVYLKTIEEILAETKEDKFQNLSTTSFKFKTDLWNFFSVIPESRLMKCVEFGTHKGQTTRVLSFLFNYVYTINLPRHFTEAELLNKDRENIKYCGFDLYSEPIEKVPTKEPVNVFFIDAGHEFDCVMSDFSRSLEFKYNEELPRYFVFDDYGLQSRTVYQAVNQLIRIGRLERICYLGHPPRHSFGGHPERILSDHEGIILKLKV